MSLLDVPRLVSVVAWWVGLEVRPGPISRGVDLCGEVLSGSTRVVIAW